nr:YbaB/EbfC family nucleoid-associated protein [Saccharopolyspora hordei]
MADYDERLARAAADAKAANESLRQMSATVTSPRGEITVQVGPSGAMEDIRLTPAARAMEAEKLAQLILTTSQEAQRKVGAQVVEIMTEYVGEGPALDFVRANMPPAAGVEPGARSGGDEDDDFFDGPVVIV